MRRRLARCPDRLSARQFHGPVRRFPPPGPRGAGSPTSPVLSADSDFSPPVPLRLVFFAWRYHRVPSLPPARAVPTGRDCCLSRPSARVPGGDDETSQVPGRPLPACPALRPRRNRQCPGRSLHRGGAFHSCHSVGFHEENDLRAQSRGLQGFLCTLRSRGRPRTTQHSVPAGWPTLTGQVFHLLGRNRRFPSCHRMHFPPSPSFAWRKTSPVPYIRKMPNRAPGGVSSSRPAAVRASPNTRRVSTGSMTPSSHNRALA